MLLQLKMANQDLKQQQFVDNKNGSCIERLYAKPQQEENFMGMS